jgi:hypothetical protein
MISPIYGREVPTTRYPKADEKNMQVLCKISNSVNDVRCKVCGQGFLVYWSRSSQAERDATRRQVIEALANQHSSSNSTQVHPRTGFNIPDWSGLPSFSAAALLGGAQNWSV